MPFLLWSPERATRRPIGAPTRRAAGIVPAVIVASLMLTLIGQPVLAVDPPPSASDPASPSASPSVSPSGSEWASPSASASASPSASASASPTPAPAPGGGLPAAFTFTGRGYGHGVGLSQHGARGRALAGQDAATILSHYYRGTVPGTVASTSQVRVLVLSSFAATSASPLRLYGRGGTWTIDGIATVFPADAHLRVWRDLEGTTGVWKIRVTSATGAQLQLSRFTGSLVVRPALDATRLQLYSKPGLYDTYRGTIRVLTAVRASVVNTLPLEYYLRGVVPMEMPSTWPTEALRAQAVAARSYAVRRLHPTTGSFDVYDDTRSQVYGGSRAERASTNAALAATSGRVLRYGSAIADTFFHSTGGGATEHNEYAWVSSTGQSVAGPVPYLRGSADVDATGRSYDAGSPYASWTTATLTPAKLGTILASDARTSVGTLASVTVTQRGVSGRVVRVRIVGSTGTRDVSGEVFRQVINAKLPSGTSPIRSSLFYLTPTG